MLEVKVHSELRNFLRQTQTSHQTSQWIHHLTMARMVARGLRLGKSAIIQTGTNHPQYYLSYLTPALLARVSVIIVAKSQIQEQLIEQEIPNLQKWLNSKKIIETKLTQDLNLEGRIAVVTPQVWLQDFANLRYSNNIPTIIEEADNLPDFIHEYLTIKITSEDWLNLQFKKPNSYNFIQDSFAKLTKSIFAHPPNPYDSYLLNENEKILLEKLTSPTNYQLDDSLINFKLTNQRLTNQDQYFSYVEVNRQKGNFILKSSPFTISNKISYLWERQPLILLANYLSPEKEVTDYSNLIGLNLDNFTCLKFSPHAQNQNLHLYIPDHLPLPNNPLFQGKVNQEILALVGAIKINHQPIIILVEDYPLQTQITTNLSAQFGSRVKLNSLESKENSILVCDSKFWLKYQFNLTYCQLLIITTLPIPSLENPLISAQVAYYKKQKKDWFRLFLLPSALKTIQQITMPIRQNQGIIALLDNRVNLRSYGQAILQVLEPYDRINYLDFNWLN